MKVRSLTILALVFSALCTVCRADTWRRAEVYLVGWEMVTRIPLTPERVRELAKKKGVFQKEASAIARMLALQELKPDKEGRAEDARLVVDLYTDTGVRVTYYASRFNLSRADNASKRPIDDSFMKYFATIAQETAESKVEKIANPPSGKK